MTDETDNHGYHIPTPGTQNWHEPLNENFERLETEVELRDQGPPGEHGYEPDAGAKYIDIADGRMYLGDGEEWTSLGNLDGYGPEDAGRYLAGEDELDFVGSAEWDGAEVGTNSAEGAESTVAGGAENTATGEGATVGGGRWNEADGKSATVAGGGGASEADGNIARGEGATVGGGEGNEARERRATVAGGAANEASEIATAVSGGWENTASEFSAAVGGGWENDALGEASAVAGGEANEASGPGATVAGGTGNDATTDGAAIGGGESNVASGAYATVGGGEDNEAAGDRTTVGGGDANAATGESAAVAGGSENTASGEAAMVPGGTGNSASGNFSFAGGRNALTSSLESDTEIPQKGSFVWGDSSDYTIRPDSTDQFVVQAGGGVTLYTRSDTTEDTGATLPAGEGAWEALSARDSKTNITEIDTETILDGVRSLEITRWSYVTNEHIDHLGPMAGDFHEQFGLGSHESRIATLDAAGVALAAIQALATKLEDRTTRIEELETRLASLEAHLEDKSPQPSDD